MLFNYYGDSCSVNELNGYLQSHNGYYPDSSIGVLNKVSLAGDRVEYAGYALENFTSKKDPTKPGSWRAGSTFLVEHGRHHPVATFRIQSKGIAEVDRWYDRTDTARVRDKMVVYLQPVMAKVSEFENSRLMGRRVNIVELPGSAGLPAAVESLLVSGTPVGINTHNNSGAGHFVVADGWRPIFGRGRAGRGTYTIKDPFWDLKTLADSTFFVNEFRLARYLELSGPSALNGTAGVASATAGEEGLAILVNGGMDIAITDPLGRQIRVDPTTGSYVSEVPGAYVLDHWCGDDESDVPSDPDGGLSVFELPGAPDGSYQLRVTTGGATGVCAAVFDTSGVLAAAAVLDTVSASTGNVYGIAYMSGIPSVNVTWLGALAVESVGRTSSGLRVFGSPSRGPVRFGIAAATAAPDAIDIYDVGGRRVATVEVEGPSVGTRVVSWNWLMSGCHDGVYFARLRSGVGGAIRLVVFR
jgi:hypothetical protein